MPGLDRRIDPVTRDYIDAAGGEYAETATIETGCYHQLVGQIDSWPGDPDAGSDTDLSGRNSTRGTVNAMEDSIKRALQVFIDSGEAADLVVDLHATATGRIVGTTNITDVQSGTVDLSAIAPIGEG